MKELKAVIPAAGAGLRFRPLTKEQPKEMLPVVDRPAIHWVVEEAVESGVTDILIITGREKRAIEDYFDSSYKLAHFMRQNEENGMEELDARRSKGDIHYTRQREPGGLGRVLDNVYVNEAIWSCCCLPLNTCYIARVPVAKQL